MNLKNVIGAILASSLMVLLCSASAEPALTTSVAKSNTSAKSAASTQSAVQALMEELKKITTLEGQFSQVLYGKKKKELQRTAGSFALKRPGFFYWEVKPPYEQIIVGNPDQLWVYDPDLEQATLHSKDRFNDTPAAVLSGDAKGIESRFDIKVLPSDKNQRMFALSEKDKAQAVFKELVFTFNKNGIETISLLDNLDQITLIEFTKVKLNGELDDSVFVFNPPPDIDIITNS